MDLLDYLFVLDHEDDITLYDDEMNNGVVSYYQMKTKDDACFNWVDVLIQRYSKNVMGATSFRQIITVKSLKGVGYFLLFLF